MKTRLIHVSLLAVMILAAFGLGALRPQAATPALAQSTADSQNLRTLSVSGVGKAFLTPDIAYVYIGVRSENRDAAKAVSANNAQASKVSDALKGFNIAPRDIQTTNFSIYPNQQFDANGKPSGLTYVVDNTVFVTVRDLSKIGDLLNAVVGAGANSINSIQFDVADKTKALSDARKAAVADARAQAEELAQAAGVTLGPVQTINISSGGTPVPMYQAKAMDFASAEASVPIASGELVIQVNVSIVYQIQ